MSRKRHAPTLTAQQKHQHMRARMASGDYSQLFDPAQFALFEAACKRLEQVGMEEEIGALRLALSRVLNEESDLNRLATNVARIASVTIRAVQTHNNAKGEEQTTLLEEISRMLDELETEGAPT